MWKDKSISELPSQVNIQSSFLIFMERSMCIGQKVLAKTVDIIRINMKIIIAHLLSWTSKGNYIKVTMSSLLHSCCLP